MSTLLLGDGNLNNLNISKTVIAILVAYLLGCINGGYYYGKIFKKTDIRLSGSHNPGALNTLRVFGPAAFVVVFLVDFTKGLAATALAYYLDLPEVAIMVTMASAIIGHIYPIQMQFKGGKGIATFLGCLTIYDYRLVAVVVILFLISFPLVRKFSITGLVALAFLPFVALIINSDVVELIFLLTTISLIIYRHRTNIQEYIATIFKTEK